MPRVLRAAVALLLSLLVLPALAGAAPGDGATVTNQDFNNRDCVPTIYGYTYCSSQVGTIHTTVTPSGNASFTFDVVDCYSFTDPSGVVLDQACNTRKGHQLTQDGVLQELGAYFLGTETFGGQTCTFTQAVHFANGQFQFDRMTSTCS